MQTHTIKRVTIAEFHLMCQAQGMPSADLLLVRCPHCKTIQCGRDFKKAPNFQYDQWNRYLGVSCIGRFRTDKGCNWTLGGLLQIHELEVIDDEGNAHPHFEVLGPTEADEYLRDCVRRAGLPALLGDAVQDSS